MLLVTPTPGENSGTTDSTGATGSGGVEMTRAGGGS